MKYERHFWTVRYTSENLKLLKEWILGFSDNQRPFFVVRGGRGREDHENGGGITVETHNAGDDVSLRLIFGQDVVAGPFK